MHRKPTTAEKSPAAAKTCRIWDPRHLSGALLKKQTNHWKILKLLRKEKVNMTFCQDIKQLVTQAPEFKWALPNPWSCLESSFSCQEEKKKSLFCGWSSLSITICPVKEIKNQNHWAAYFKAGLLGRSHQWFRVIWVITKDLVLTLRKRKRFGKSGSFLSRWNESVYAGLYPIWNYRRALYTYNLISLLQE